MIKAVFMDYYGTVVHENGPITMEVVKRIYRNNTASSPQEVFGFWWKSFKKKLDESNGEDFRTQHDVALDAFEETLEYFRSPEHAGELLARMEEHWCTTPPFEDALEFLDRVKLPVYFVTNCDDRYVYASLEKYNIHPQGVITSEQAKYSKPREEIFLYALEKAGLNADEVIHIGDSPESDVRCPGRAGITGIWLNREGAPVPEGIRSVRSLAEIEL